MKVTPKLETILVPVDFSRCSMIAFEYAKVVGSMFSSAIHLIHVVDRRYVERTAAVFEQSEDEIARKLCLRAKNRFEELLADHDDRESVAGKIVTVGIPFQTIAMRAQALPADIIIMGGHGRMGNGEIDKIFFGSNAEKVVRLLPCPVLCVPEEMAGTVPAAG